MPELVDKIYQVLTTQEFADWHAAQFEDHITGEDLEKYGDHKTSIKACKEQIKELFQL